MKTDYHEKCTDSIKITGYSFPDKNQKQMTDTRKPIQQETDPADTIKAIINDKGFKISSMKRSFYKKQFAPEGLTRLIVRIKGNRKLYEGADWIFISDDAEKNQESENEIVKRLFDKFINVNKK